MIDLHFHSTCSDGRMTPRQWSEQIINNKIKYCALTDHDSVDGILEMKEFLKDTEINFINGVELTALYKKQEIHVLIYDFDLLFMKKLLKERYRLVEEQRVQELKKTIELFKKEGFNIDNNLKLNPKKPVGLIVALHIYSQESNQKFLIEKHGHLLDEKEFFDLYQSSKAPCYVPRSGVNIDWILERLSGVVDNIILAHPFVPVSFLVKPLTKKDINDLIQKGITGIEVYHSLTSFQDIEYLEKFVHNNNLFYTGGSDSHGKEKDVKNGYYNDEDRIPSFKLKNIEFIK